MQICINADPQQHRTEDRIGLTTSCDRTLSSTPLRVCVKTLYNTVYGWIDACEAANQ